MTGRARDLPLTLSAALGVLVVTATVALSLAHARPVVFRSGSMSPTIPTGSAALVHRVPAEALRRGDIVTVPSGSTFVTHRIVQLTRADGVATLQLKGDANAAADPSLQRVDSAERVVATVPWLGYVIAGLSGPAGRFLAGVYVLWLLRRLVGSGVAVKGHDVRHRAAHDVRHRAAGPRRQLRRLVVGVTVAAVALSGAAVAGATRAVAAWGETASVQGTTLGASTVPPPATFTCGALGAFTVTFTWSAVPGATSYDLHSGPNGATVTNVSGTSRALTTSVIGGTAWVQANVAYAGTTWTSAPSTTRTYTVAVVSICT